MKIGDVVEIGMNDSVLDCCKGKRGRIVHIGVGGGFLLHTDHFCPVERDEAELTLVSRRVLAEEVLASQSEWLRVEYEAASDELLQKYADCDEIARAVLVLRGKED